ncbi:MULTISPECIES: NACHT domain-containing NTPase [Corallococcus]|uniref:NACHT domain-containing protein n=1 Tax=Corallococcus TaxID=83461 RepID=UPI0011C41B85|nr:MULTISPECIES: hypothetical protein [Corallococcus]
MHRKAQLRRNDQYGVLVAAERCARLIDAYEFGSSGPEELRQEDARFPYWDDFSELWRDGALHGWQVKRQRAPLPAEVLAEQLRSLQDSRLTRAHLALPSLVQIQQVGSLAHLEELCEALREPGFHLDAFLEHLNAPQLRWLEWTSKQLGLTRPQDTIAVLGRLEIHALGNERTLREAALLRLRQFDDPQAVLDGIISYLSSHPGESIAVRYEVLEQEVLQGRSRRSVSRPGAAHLRTEYLRAVTQEFASLSPLGATDENLAEWPRIQDVYVMSALRTASRHERPDPVLDPLRKELLSQELTHPSLEREPTHRNLGLHPQVVELLDWLRTPSRLATHPIFGVEGEVGSGKSMLLAYLRNLLAEEAQHRFDAPIPVLLVASDLATGSIEEAFLRRAPGFRDTRVLTPSSAGCIYLVDGLDEVEPCLASTIAHRLRELAQHQGTAALVLAGRPSRPLAFPSQAIILRLTPWSRTQVEMFLERWRRAAPEQVAALESIRRFEALLPLLSHPLTATFCLVLASQDPGALRSRAALFRGITAQLFQGWVRTREGQSQVPPSWAEMSPTFERLALEMLREGTGSLSHRRLRQQLGKFAPNREEEWLDLAHRKFGLLVRQENGTSRFVLRGIAEHLGGAALYSQGDAAILSVASKRWAEEPVRHAIGLSAELDSPEHALSLISRLLPEGPNLAHDNLRALMVAARAALDLGENASPLADRLAQALVPLLDREDSTWIPALVASVIHEMARLEGPCWRAMLRHLREPLATSIWDHSHATHGTQDWRHWEHVLKHSNPTIRLAALEQLATWVHEPSVQQVLVLQLFDAGMHFDRWIPIQSGLILRKAPRDDPFTQHWLVPMLASIARAEWQLPSGGAALALLPSEADPELLARCFRSLGRLNIAIPSALAQLAESEAGRVALERTWPEWKEARPWEPSTQRPQRIMGPRTNSPPLTRRRDVIQAMAPALARMSTMELTELKINLSEILPVLCEYAMDKPEPLLKALVPRWPSGLRAQDQRLVGKAAVKHSAIRQALLSSWREEKRGTLSSFHGDALEPLIENGDMEAARLYAQWLPLSHWIRSASGSGMNVPSAIVLRHPEIRPVAETLALTYIQNATKLYDGADGKKSRAWSSVCGSVLHSLRPAWENNAEIATLLHELSTAEDFEAIQPALLAYPQPPFPDWLQPAVRRRLEQMQDVPGWQEERQVAAYIRWAEQAGCAEILRPFLERLRQSAPKARYVVASALVNLLEPQEREDLASTIATEWPSGWEWHYDREEILGRLVMAAPSAWFARLRELARQSAFWMGVQGLPVISIAKGLLTSGLRPEERQELFSILKTISPEHPWTGEQPFSIKSQRPADALAELEYEVGGSD